ncbi:myosin IC heavy chain-like isoform X2 [Carex littledalei]|uniref:Myosin IC heavy chain-like isoform X2 n=1 Tax=Carex littledalei TaxID=544730 RepID=A0A833R691_9POAL|nr:myosin IC heavy chain-like isoform X2 [Carex littledalei]
MDRFRTLKRIQVEPDQFSQDNDVAEETPTAEFRPYAAGDEEENAAEYEGMRFMGMKVVRRRALTEKDCGGDYVGVDFDQYLSKILSKQGDKNVLFADYILKLTGSGKMKKRILIVTDFAIYLVDPDTDSLKRRIALAAIDCVYMSNLDDNFLAIIAPSEYDCLMATSRKKEIADALMEATKGASAGYQIEVIISNQ